MGYNPVLLPVLQPLNFAPSCWTQREESQVSCWPLWPLYHLPVVFWLFLLFFGIIWIHGIHDGAEIQRRVFPSVRLLFLGSSAETHKQLLPRAELRFRVKAAASAERAVGIWGRWRYLLSVELRNSHLWALKCGERMSLACVVNSDLNSVKTKQH